MPAELLASHSLAIEVKRFRSAAEALRRQDYFQDCPFGPDQSGLLIWQSPRALLAAPRDTRLPQFDESARACAEAGWQVTRRRGGGRICPVSPGTLQLAINRPVSSGVTVETAYEEMADLIEALLDRFGLRAERGPCPEAFCPGRYDIAVAGRKIAGLAQTWRSYQGTLTAITGASVIIEDRPEDLAAAVNLFYNGIQGAPVCRADAIGSLRRMAGYQVTTEDASHLLHAML